jgi:hypothetical protein
MSKRNTKKEEVNPVIFTIVLCLIILFVKGCDAYFEAHHEQWQEEARQRSEQRMFEAFHACKFEHDY